MASRVVPPPRRWLPAVVAGLVCGGGGWWAGHEAVSSQAPTVAASGGVVLAEVREATVGRSLSYGVTVSQETKTLARNALAGVVVSVHPGVLDEGDTAYVVAGVPVRVVRGNSPFYRDLSEGAGGADVRQLESALVDLGLLSTADTAFDARTKSAVREWQRRLGLPRTGSVPLGELVAVPTLPTTISLGSDVTPGAVLAGGEESVRAAVGERVFALELSQDQARQVPSDAGVQVLFKQHVWTARITTSTIEKDSNLTRLLLRAPDGGPVCGTQCNELPNDPTVQLAGKVAVVAPATGPAVPAAAVQSRADGSTFVLDDDGQAITVTVKGAGSGLVVVEGLSPGQRVRLPSGSGRTSVPSPPSSPSSPPTGSSPPSSSSSSTGP